MAAALGAEGTALYAAAITRRASMNAEKSDAVRTILTPPKSCGMLYPGYRALISRLCRLLRDAIGSLPTTMA